MAKHNCAICGAEISLVSEQKLVDGNFICKKVCSKKTFKILDKVEATLGDVTAHIEQVEKGTKIWNELLLPLKKAKDKDAKLKCFGVGSTLLYVSPSTGLVAVVETRRKIFIFGKTELACVYRLADLVEYDYEDEKVKNSDGKMETKEFCHLVFKDTAGMYSFRLEVANSKSYESMAKYFDTLFGIQKTLRNSVKNAKRQMNAIKSFAGAVKAAANGTLDEAQATDTVEALDASAYGDRTEWIKKADATLAAFQKFNFHRNIIVQKEDIVMRNMKKILALLLAVMMLIGLVGCNAPDDPVPGTTDPAASTKGTDPGKENDPVQSEPPKIDENLTIHENTFFTVGYNEEDGWTLAEDDIYVYEGGGNAYLRILDTEGYTELLVEIEAYETDHESFRDSLYFGGFDEKAYVAGTLEAMDIGGQSMLALDEGDGKRTFFGRDEAAGVTYEVYTNDWEDPRVSALIENITFIISGTDNIDPPWYWEGQPFSGGTVSQMVGTYTLTAQFLPMGDPMITHETFEHDIAVVGDMVYLLSDCALYQYAYDGTSLTFVKEIPLDGEYEILEKGADGNIILSSFMEPVIGHDGEAVQFSYEGPDNFTVAPGATWGISWFSSGDDCQLYAFNDGALSGSAFPFPEVDIISQVCIDSNYIFVSGSSKEDDEHYVFVYDYSGALQLQLGGEPDGFGLGSITYATSTPNGFLALDGNMREVVLWTADGTWIGAVDDGDLFGTGYPWIAAADIADDGSILVVMSDTRADESADEVLVFKLSAF